MGCNTSKEVIQSVINEKTKGSPGAEPDPGHGVGEAQPDNEPQEINLFEGKLPVKFYTAPDQHERLHSHAILPALLRPAAEQVGAAPTTLQFRRGP